MVAEQLFQFSPIGLPCLLRHSHPLSQNELIQTDVNCKQFVFIDGLFSYAPQRQLFCVQN